MINRMTHISFHSASMTVLRTYIIEPVLLRFQSPEKDVFWALSLNLVNG